MTILQAYVTILREADCSSLTEERREKRLPDAATRVSDLPTIE